MFPALILVGGQNPPIQYPAIQKTAPLTPWVGGPILTLSRRSGRHPIVRENLWADPEAVTPAGGWWSSRQTDEE